LAKQKETSLVEALKKRANFIKAIENLCGNREKSFKDQGHWGKKPYTGPEEAEERNPRQTF